MGKVKAELPWRYWPISRSAEQWINLAMHQKKKGGKMYEVGGLKGPWEYGMFFGGFAWGKKMLKCFLIHF